jgi:hypothetical protein
MSKLILRHIYFEPIREIPTWRTRSPYLYPLETGWPSYTPRHRVPILVAFYDMHWLQWDCSFPRSPHGESKKVQNINTQLWLTLFAFILCSSDTEWRGSRLEPNVQCLEEYTKRKNWATLSVDVAPDSARVERSAFAWCMRICWLRWPTGPGIGNLAEAMHTTCILLWSRSR